MCTDTDPQPPSSQLPTDEAQSHHSQQPRTAQQLAGWAHQQAAHSPPHHSGMLPQLSSGQLQATGDQRRRSLSFNASQQGLSSHGTGQLPPVPAPLLAAEEPTLLLQQTSIASIEVQRWLDTTASLGHLPEPKASSQPTAQAQHAPVAGHQHGLRGQASPQRSLHSSPSTASKPHAAQLGAAPASQASTPRKQPAAAGPQARGAAKAAAAAWARSTVNELQGTMQPLTS